MKETWQRLGAALAVTCTACIVLGCAGGERKELAKSSKISIKMVTSESVHGCMIPDAKNIWVCGSYGMICHGVDNGTAWQWTTQNSGVDILLVNGTFINDKQGWIAGLLGTVIHTSDGGSTWVKQNTGTDRHLFNVVFVDERHGWAAGDGNTVIHTSDGGNTWIRQTPEEDKILNDILFVDATNGWVVGESGIILNTTDGGATWNQVMPSFFERKTVEEEFENPRPALFSIAATDKNNIWLCGIDGTIIKTTDAGATWTQLSVPTKEGLYSLCIKNGKGWAVGDKGTYLMSPDGGTTWQFVDDVITTKQWLGKVRFTDSQNGWVTGAMGTIVRTTDGGTTWQFLSGLSYKMEFFQMPKALEFKGMVFE
ncbi:MAG: YCF48-related protein [Desulfobacterota bacterium]|nr:YCF48-related protein [Thermodesulfobacteriota bacterium]